MNTPTFRRAPRLTIVVARSSNNVIGHNGKMPWHIPEDLRHFREVTTGGVLIMGRKTHESIGKPLPGRVNIVVSRDPSYQAPGCHTVTSLQDAFDKFPSVEEMFLIGGAQLYKEGLPFATKAIITELQFPVFGDTYFHDLNPAEWHVTKTDPEECHKVDYCFVTYERIVS